MKHTHLIWISIIALLLLGLCVSGVQAVTWTSASGCWTATYGAYTIVMWNATGTTTWTPPTGVTKVEYLVVGAGGGALAAQAGYVKSGGGGGGEVRTNYGIDNLSVTGTLSITVGAGVSGSTGGNSYLTGLASYVYGGGAGQSSGAGLSGGSGGGGGNSGAGGASTAIATYGHGNIGGTSVNYASGGGGGAGAVGGTPAASKANGGIGGAGYYCAITGENIPYGGGGGGGTYYQNEGWIDGTGGVGGGGTSANGTANTGGGGGGIGGIGVSAATTGGSGVVIIRYLTPMPPVASFTTNTTSGTAPLAVPAY